jgi:ABC-type multidrug transport system permease subunit
MPGWLQAVAHVLPLYYIIDGLNAVMVYSNFSGAMVDLAVSAVLAAVFFILAMSVFSWKEA